MKAHYTKKCQVDQNMNRIELIIHLNEYQNNLKKISEKLPESCSILAVVKANAYGHGAVEIARAAIQKGVRYLGVACLKEFKELRDNGITHPILLLAEPLQSEWNNLPHDLTYTVYTPEFIGALNKEYKIHLKIDTGMNRLGAKTKEIHHLLDTINAKKNLNLEGIYTHLAQSEIPNSGFTQIQLDQFREILKNCNNASLMHTANSGAIRYFPDSMFNMVRLGMDSFENVMELQSEIKTIKAGESVGYDAGFTASDDMTVATIAAGYADGISTRFRGGSVQIKGRIYPVIGKICMDMFMVNLSGNPDNIKRGDKAVILGKNALNMYNFAQITGLNPREITCAIGNGRRYTSVVVD
jgi:alanine racemase